jgi:hypothetical protein
MPDIGGGPSVPPQLIVLAGRKGRPSLLPFVAVLLALLGIGLVGLLMLNTELNKGAFALRQANREATALTQQQQQYQQELSRLTEPGALAARAQQLGLVPNGNPAFLDPNSGAVLGVPTPAPTPSPVPPTPPAIGAVLLPNTPTPSGTPGPTGTAGPAGAAVPPIGNPAATPATTPTPTQLPTPSGTLPPTPMLSGHAPVPTAPQPSGQATGAGR